MDSFAYRCWCDLKIKSVIVLALLVQWYNLLVIYSEHVFAVSFPTAYGFTSSSPLHLVMMDIYHLYENSGGNSTCSITFSYRIVCSWPDFNAELDALQCDPEATPFLLSTAHVTMSLCMRYNQATLNMSTNRYPFKFVLSRFSIASYKIMLKRREERKDERFFIWDRFGARSTKQA